MSDKNKRDEDLILNYESKKDCMDQYSDAMSDKKTNSYLYEKVESLKDDDELITLMTLMEVAKTQTKRVQELESKQLSIDELREQFESKFMGGVTPLGKRKFNDGLYMNSTVRDNWHTWVTCARTNNLIKDGE